MSEVFFASDTHFSHANIIKYCSRPYADVEEMDEALIANWNARVRPGDRIYHLGDFAFRNHGEILARLQGSIHLIRGNHDKGLERWADRFASFQDYKDIKIGDQHVVLLHYAMRVWDRSHHGSFHLYGHSHGNLPEDPGSLSFDVGVDPNGYAPVSFEEVRDRMSRKEFVPVDHHGR
jgi:calcineurin-like phosphoesterase family protein